jgi:hypothetical protein
MNEQQRAVVQQVLDALFARHPFTYSEEIAALRQLLEQPETVPLTDEQADLLINGRGDEDDDDYVEPTGDGYGLTDADLVKLIRRVEEHHGIKKGGGHA